MPRKGTPINLYLSDESRAELKALAKELRRPLHDEIRHAVERHLANPPKLLTTELESVEVEEKKKRKRKK